MFFRIKMKVIFNTAATTAMLHVAQSNMNKTKE